MKKVLAVILMSGLMLSFGGCKKKEEKPQLPPGHPSMEGGMPPAMQGQGMPDMPKKDRKVIVPKEIAAKWKAVKLAIEDKKAKSAAKEYTVAVGSDLAVPNTKITIKVLAFLPDFRMGETDITSASDKPNNPAVQVAIMEPGREEWKGWLYANHPAIHPYTHEAVGVTLVGGVSK